VFERKRESEKEGEKERERVRELERERKRHRVPPLPVHLLHIKVLGDRGKFDTES